MPPADLDAILAKGGEHRIALLRYCAISGTMEPVFVFLVTLYRLRPTHAGALALYDVFCAPGAPGRVRAPDVLPPRNLRLSADAGSVRAQWAQVATGEARESDVAMRITTPHRDLFDVVTQWLRRDPESPWSRVGHTFDVGRTPEENLPGGRMSPGQRQFRDERWLPVIRPRLVDAGFWPLASIG
jgi:hypothetical protein